MKTAERPWRVAGGSRLKSVTVGSHLDRYDSMLVLTHFKGHGMAGSGGSLDKNVAIGCASGREGKAEIHQGWERGPAFLERMADAGKAGGRIAFRGDASAYLDRACAGRMFGGLLTDCTAHIGRSSPKLAILGILASTDIPRRGIRPPID